LGEGLPNISNGFLPVDIFHSSNAPSVSDIHYFPLRKSIHLPSFMMIDLTNLTIGYVSGIIAAVIFVRSLLFLVPSICSSPMGGPFS
jgi:hypothetical protein